MNSLRGLWFGLHIYISRPDREGDTIDQVVTLSSSVASLETPKAVVMVQAGLQLLGNVCVKCAEGQERVWQLCFPDNFK